MFGVALALGPVSKKYSFLNTILFDIIFFVNYEELISKIKTFDAFKGDLLLNEPLANKSTFKVGGTADLFIKPINYYSFQIVLSVLIQENFKFFILGGGSNIVFPDHYDGVILSTQSFAEIDYMEAENCPEDFGKIELAGNQCLVTCFSGTSIATLVNFCTKNNIHGVEQFAGLPGTVGGALYMNARCFEKSISDVLFSTTYMDLQDSKVKLHHILKNPSDWDYKKSPFQDNNSFITTATFLLEQQSESEHNQIESECKKFIAERVDKGHFKYPSAGSVFKNNHTFGKPSGKIIDEAGLKGYQIGGAKIADFHGNFIINIDKATSSDIENLVKHTQKTVKNQFGFELEPEIIFLK